ncbi:hypothetical protein ND748_17835 [Frankia sp. AiPs1]|uniref:hypothetical protein n=1 Tax=Frankia sp. AiPs1 TaxID=573493 RepID=UPI00204449C3|nr:hypothetical protein [Frankia sp. AiPs1]MCM3923516.1 hypothetical protein [Frankia sp. AiPs1]
MGFAAFRGRQVVSRAAAGAARAPRPARVRRLAPAGPATVDGDRAHAAWVGRLFGRARWALHDDGRCLFVPAPGHAREDVFPVGGVAEEAGAQVRVALRRHADALAVTVTGLIVPDPALGPGVGQPAPEAGRAPGGAGRPAAVARFTGQYELRAGDTVRRHPVSVPLAEIPPDGGPPRPLRIDGVPVPVVYACQLTGRSGGAAFGPLRAELSVVDPLPGTRDPIEITIFPAAADPPGAFPPDAFPPDAFPSDAFLPDAFLPGEFRPSAFPPDIIPAGELLWLTSVPGAGRGETGSYRVEVRAGTADVVVDADDGAVGVTFAAPHRLLGAMPVAARRARLRAVFRGTADGRTLRVDGQVSAAGLLLDEAVDYTATLVGQADLADGFDGDRLDGNGLDGNGFDRAWAAAGYGRA